MLLCQFGPFRQLGQWRQSLPPSLWQVPWCPPTAEESGGTRYVGEGKEGGNVNKRRRERKRVEELVRQKGWGKRWMKEGRQREDFCQPGHYCVLQVACNLQKR